MSESNDLNEPLGSFKSFDSSLSEDSDNHSENGDVPQNESKASMIDGEIHPVTHVVKKRINLFGSVSLLTNNMTGGGMVLLAQLYQEAGWLVPTLALIGLGSMTALATLFLVELMALMPGNGKFQQSVEYSGVMKHFCNKPIFYITFVFYQCSLAATNISLIVQSVQVVDFAMVAMFGKSCLLPSMYPDFYFGCPEALVGHETPFENHTIGLTLGLLVTAILVLPLAFFNLDDNIMVQNFAFVSLFVIIGIWSGLFINEGLDMHRTPLFGTSYLNVMGTCLFNFAFLSSIPSWVNDKRADVKVGDALVWSLPISVFMFVIAGMLCGMAFAPWHDDTNLLDRLLDLHSPLASATFFAFPIIANLTSIPVTSIFQRLNLIEAGCPTWLANILAVILPWVVAIPLYSGKGFQQLSMWSGLLITSAINFIFPPAVYAWVAYKDMQQAKLRVAERQELGDENNADEAIFNQLTKQSDEYVDLPPSFSTVSLSSEVSITEPLSSTESIVHVEADPKRWRLFDDKHLQWRFPLSLGLLLIMTVLTILTVVQQIQMLSSPQD